MTQDYDSPPRSSIVISPHSAPHEEHPYIETPLCSIRSATLLQQPPPRKAKRPFSVMMRWPDTRIPIASPASAFCLATGIPILRFRISETAGCAPR